MGTDGTRTERPWRCNADLVKPRRELLKPVLSIPSRLLQHILQLLEDIISPLDLRT